MLTYWRERSTIAGTTSVGDRIRSGVGCIPVGAAQIVWVMVPLEMFPTRLPIWSPIYRPANRSVASPWWSLFMERISGLVLLHWISERRRYPLAWIATASTSNFRGAGAALQRCHGGRCRSWASATWSSSTESDLRLLRGVRRRFIAHC